MLHIYIFILISRVTKILNDQNVNYTYMDLKRGKAAAEEELQEYKAESSNGASSC